VRWNTKRRRARAVAALLVAAVVAAACGGGGDEEETAPSTTTTEATTTTTAAPAPTAPLTGVEEPDQARRERPALVVKIDNHDRDARPQVGLDVADVVYEEMVEGGATRFAAIFQSTDSDPVGPVRSARTTDVELIAPLNNPLFAYAGANEGVEAAVQGGPLVNVGWNVLPPEYFRVRGRKAPNNLFSNTSQLYAKAPAGAGAPPALFQYRSDGEDLPADAEAAAGVAMSFAGKVNLQVDWTWDDGAGVWRRNQNGTPHTVERGEHIGAHNVVVQMTRYHATQYVDVTGNVSPEAELVGSGEVWVLTAGRVVKGHWSRSAPGGVTTYTDGGGRPIELTPGRTWVELLPPGQATLK
jgi:hypothetical protein